MENREASWFDQRPSVRVAWLRWCNLWRRRPQAVFASAAAILVLGALGRLRVFAYGIAFAALSPWFVVTLTAVLATVLTLRRRWRLESRRHHDWLAPLPRDLPLSIRSAAGALAAWAISAVLIALWSLAAQVPAWIALWLIGYATVGIGLGTMLAVAVAAVNDRPGRGGRSQASTQPRSRYSAERPAGASMTRRAALAPLGAWPTAEAQFRDRPKIRARSLVLLLLAMPMGAPGGVVLAVAATWLIVLHLLNLTRALVRTAFSAARWLAPTAIEPVRFAVALAHRTLVAQALAGALLLAIGYVTRGSSEVRLAGLILAGWLAAVAVLAMATSVLALRHRTIAVSSPYRRRR